jgi:hypothetical protein
MGVYKRGDTYYISYTERYFHLMPEHKRKVVEMLPDWESAETGGTKVTQKGEGAPA